MKIAMFAHFKEYHGNHKTKQNRRIFQIYPKKLCCQSKIKMFLCTSCCRFVKIELFQVMDVRGKFGEHEKSVRVLKAQPREILTKAPSTVSGFFESAIFLSGYGFCPHRSGESYYFSIRSPEERTCQPMVGPRTCCEVPLVPCWDNRFQSTQGRSR